MIGNFGKALLLGGVVVLFVSVDTCGKRGFRPNKVVEKPKFDTMSVTIEGMNYFIIRSKSGDIEVINTSLEKKEVENLVD